MTTYTIMWGHSGTYGREWSTAQEASRYTAEVWGELEAADADAAARQVATESGSELIDWHESAGSSGLLHVVLGDAADLLAQRIDESGMSARRYATDVLLRNERTVRRWLAGESPIPQEVLDFLRRRDE